MLIDTHAHLTELKSRLSTNDFENFVNSLNFDDVKYVISIGCTGEEIEESKNIAETYPKKVFYTAGLYPHKNPRENKNKTDDVLLEDLERRLINQDKQLVAIGECGLDFSVVEEEYQRDKKNQFRLFEEQLYLASKYEKPIVIHSRFATEDTISLIKNFKSDHHLDVVWHCFNEGKTTAKALLDLGIKFSVNGIVTYKTGQDLRDALSIIPLSEIMFETDSPFLTPEPIRSTGIKMNKPNYVKIVAEMVAKIKDIDFDTMSNESTKNALEFFGIPEINND